MKVYIVEAYDIADDKSYVEGVFGTVEKAEEYVRGMYLDTTETYTITEVELDKGYFFVADMGWGNYCRMRKAIP